jgi:membrane-associated phospholipid phosphatase
LSDLWTTALIDALRPISGLDNCFPSFHVASMTIVSVLGYVYRLRFRHAVMFLAGTVILSTFMLGIHWLPDIAAGFALGLITTRLALRSNLPMPAGHLDDLTVEAVK